MDKRQKLTRLFGEDDLAAMRAVRRVFDPRELLNPDKVLPAPGSHVKTHPAGGRRPVPEGMWV